VKSSWALQDAKNKFSEVVQKALKEGPQLVTKNGRDAVVIIDAGAFRKQGKHKDGLVSFFRKSPLHGLKLDLERSRDTGREVDL